jgi:hypothetical protein
LRVGEIRALGWRRDVDLVAGTITVNRLRRAQACSGRPRSRS